MERAVTALCQRLGSVPGDTTPKECEAHELIRKAADLIGAQVNYIWAKDFFWWNES